MNLKKLGRTLGMVAAVAIMAMVLQGCGGDDDNSSVEQDLRAQIETLQGQLTTANTAKTDAEAAQMAAETAQATAEAAQMAAEAARKDAEALRDTAVAERAAALAAQMVAETAQADAETAQMAAETAQATAEAAQMTAETERDAANVAKMMAEEAQATAEAARMMAEEAQATAEAARMMAEADAEAARMAAEEAKMAAAAAVEAAEMMAAEAIAAAEAAAAAETAAAQAATEAAAEAQAAAEAEEAAAEAAQMAAAEAQAAAEAEKAAAEAAVMEAAASVEAAQAAQAAAEADKMAADEARMQAEADLATAQAAQAAAEALQAVAEDRATAAEEAQMTAEAAQATAETAQAAAEAAQATAEAAQAAAEEAQAAAEAALDSGVAEALAAQQAAETERDEANAAKMAAEEAQATAQAAQAAAEALQATAEAAQMAAETARDNALAAKETAEDNLGAANTALTQANAALAQANTDLATARADATKYKEMYEEAKKQLDGGPGAPDAAMHEAARMAAEAIQAVSAETPNFSASVSLGCSDAVVETTGDQAANCTDDANDEVSISSVTRIGSTLKFKVTEGTGNTQVTKFDTSKHSPTSVAAPDGWMAVALTNAKSGGRTDRAVVYTNIEAPESKAFTTQYRAQLGSNGYITVSTADAKIDLAPKSPLTAAREREYVAANSVSYSGTYHGASGTYDCVHSDGCTFYRSVQPDDSVEIVLTTGTTGTGAADSDNAWRFTPASGAQAIVADGDYLVFGGWLTEATNTASSRNVAAFSNGADPFTASNIEGLTGRATYSGPAAGYYAKRNRLSTAAAAGRFTATATLKADFGATNAPGTISGTVADFVIPNPVDGIVGSNPDWSVTLTGTQANNTATAVGADTSGVTAGAAGGIAWAGEWGAEFYGNTTGVATALPTGIAGVFEAQQTGTGVNPQPEYEGLGADARIKRTDQGFVGVVGAFGAELQ